MIKINFQNNITKANADTFNTMQDNIEDAINEVKDYTDTKGIYESGSNENGSYIKYDDGTMICSNRVTQTKNISSGYEGVYYVTTDNVNFPETFIANPYVAVTIEQNNSLVTFNMIEALTNYFRGYIWKSQSKNNVTYHINYIAIGRWK